MCGFFADIRNGLVPASLYVLRGASALVTFETTNILRLGSVFRDVGNS